MIVNLLIKNKIGTLVVVYNSGWKDSINISKEKQTDFCIYPSFTIDKLFEEK